MSTTHDLRDALRRQERHAPTEADVLAELNRRRRPHRLSRWSVSILAAATVALIVIGVSALARPHTTITTIPATPGSLTAPATTSSPTTAPTTQQSINLHNAQEQATRDLQSLQLQAQQAARSAQNSAAAARACTQATSSTPLMVNGHLDATRIESTIASCARAYGARAGYTAQWVQTTAGALSTLTTGHPQRDTTAIVAAQIHGTFTTSGQSGQAETMMLVLSPDGSLTPGTMTNGKVVDLAVLGTVHRV